MTFLRFLTAIAIAFTTYFLAGNVVQLVAPIELSAADRKISQTYTTDACVYPTSTYGTPEYTAEQKVYDDCYAEKQPAIDQARSEVEAKIALAATVRSAIVFIFMLVIAVAVFRHNPFLGSGFLGAGLLFLLLFPLVESMGGSMSMVPYEAAYGEVGSTLSTTERALILTKSIIEAVLVVLLIAADVFFFEKDKTSSARAK